MVNGGGQGTRRLVTSKSQDLSPPAIPATAPPLSARCASLKLTPRHRLAPRACALLRSLSNDAARGALLPAAVPCRRCLTISAASGHCALLVAVPVTGLPPRVACYPSVRPGHPPILAPRPRRRIPPARRRRPAAPFTLPVPRGAADYEPGPPRASTSSRGSLPRPSASPPSGHLQRFVASASVGRGTPSAHTNYSSTSPSSSTRAASPATDAVSQLPVVLPRVGQTVLHGAGSHVPCGCGRSWRRCAQSGDGALGAWVQQCLHHQALPHKVAHYGSAGIYSSWTARELAEYQTVSVQSLWLLPRWQAHPGPACSFDDQGHLATISLELLNKQMVSGLGIQDRLGEWHPALWRSDDANIFQDTSRTKLLLYLNM